MFADVSSLFILPPPSSTQITFHDFKFNPKSKPIQNHAKSPPPSSACSNKICLICGTRPFLATLFTSLIPTNKSNASNPNPDDPMAVLNRVHPPRANWYEEFYAAAMDRTLKSYEAEIAGYRSELFANLTEKKAAKILEIGIGAGPNLKYYGSPASGASVVGVDPNKKMEKYAQAAVEASGLP